MILGSIARRYAKALFDLAVEAGRVEPWAEGLAALQKAVASSPELRDLLENPVYARERRQAVAGQLARALSLDPLPSHLLALLADRNRLAYLSGIADTFGQLADQKLGRIRARVTSAVALSDGEAQALSQKLAAATGAQVLLERSVEPDLLGGLVTQVGSLVYDGSLAAQLEALRRSMKQ